MSHRSPPFFPRRETRRSRGERARSPIVRMPACRSRAAALSVVGLIGIVAISFYMQTLFALSSQSLALTERVWATEAAVERTEAESGERLPAAWEIAL